MTIEVGANFTRTITWKDNAGSAINITGYTAKMMFRPWQSDGTVLITLTETSGLTLGGSAGTIGISILAAVTGAITVPSGVYDLELISPTGVVTRLLEGSVNFSPAVTR